MSLDKLANITSDMSTQDAVGVARMGTGLLRKFAAPVDVALAGVQGHCEERDGLKELAERFGDLQAAAEKSGYIRKKLASLRDRWKERVGEAVVSASGAAAGAAIGTAIFPGLGTIGGLIVGGAFGMGGGVVADKLYNQFKPVPEQDAVAIAITIDRLHQEGYKIPSEITSTLLLAMQGGATGKRAEERLYQVFGTRDFNEALQTAMANKQMPKLRGIIKEFETSVAGAFPLPLDPDSPEKTLGTQVADMINAGAIRTTGIIANPRSVGKYYKHYIYHRDQQQEEAVAGVQPEVPETPSRGRSGHHATLRTA